MLCISQTFAARIVVERLASPCTPADVLQALAGQADPVVLESSALHAQHGRYSILACRPLEVLTLDRGRLSDAGGNVLVDGDDEGLWATLHAAFSCIRPTGPAASAYVPGWLGYIGYEVGRHIERLPGKALRDTAFPDLRLGFYDAILLYDNVDRAWSLVRLELAGRVAGAGEAAEFLKGLLARAVAQGEPAATGAEQANPCDRPLAQADSNFTPPQYRQAVRKAIAYIAAGDIFQVNLSQRLMVAGSGDPLDIYRSLRRRNPAWYSAFMSFEGRANGQSPWRCAVVSSSPELFLHVRNGVVLTRPIKGTRRRGGHGPADEAAASDLLHSPKDNAELAMIIDLLRNDLGRVCRYGSVRVTEPCRLETHPTVFHLVGSVQGELRPGVGISQLLRATLPGGSITGAPKIRAMEIIDELEGVARGVYCGCIGIVGVDGSCDFNIAIRTIACQDAIAYLSVGGGIVADSTDQGEFQETLDKARALLEAIHLQQFRK